MKSSPSSNSGFNVTELMLVVVIASILATIAIPSFASLTRSQRVKNATFELYSSLSLARSEAIKRNNDATITFTTNAKNELSWVITGFDVDGTTVRTIRKQDYIKGLVITPSAGTQIIYHRTGRPAATGTFQIDTSEVTTPTPLVRCVSIELSGMPRIRQGVCT